MTCRVLVVDDIAANVTLLEARLLAEYFEVLTASNGVDALAICARGECDVVLLDVMMPGMDGFEVCRRLKADPKTTHIPVVMVSALDQRSDRLEGLRAGADDFLTKPVDDLALLTRVKSLSRMKQMTDELRLRAASDAAETAESPSVGRGSVLVVDDKAISYERTVRALSQDAETAVVTNPHEALFRIAEAPVDLVVVSLSLDGFDALRLCSQLRSIDATRLVPILLVSSQGEEAVVRRGLELGVDDFIARPVDACELRARAQTLIRRKRLNDSLRASVQRTMEMAVRDTLTGLGNRRHFERHARNAFERARAGGQSLSLVMFDIDRFKAVNDTHGHPAGDVVLKEFAKRLQDSIRSRDTACRLGGEEFVLLMPGTDRDLAMIVADRIRQSVATHPFLIDGGREQLDITVSAGVAVMASRDASVDDILHRADDALYLAKRSGRDRVMAQAA